MSAADFAIPAEPGRQTMQAAVLRPFHWNEDFLVEEMPVENGLVQRKPDTTKWSVIDRYSGTGVLAKMFWTGCGPVDPDTALTCSVAHDSHNVWCIGSSDEAMAKAVNRLQEIDGGWVLVHKGEIVAEARLEVGGLMTARTAEDFDREMQAFYAAAGKVEWMFKPTALNLWKPGFPEFLKFATLTCSPWALGAGGAQQAGARGLRQRADRRDPQGGLVTLRGRRVKGRFIHAPRRGEIEVLDDVVLTLDAEGTVIDVGSGDADVVLPEGTLVLPGFVDLHIHAPQYPQLGQALDAPLEVWLGKYTFPLEARYADLDFARPRYETLVKDLIANGTTTALYFATAHLEATKLLADICLAAGQRALVGKVVMDDPASCPEYYRDASPEAARVGNASAHRLRAWP